MSYFTSVSIRDGRNLDAFDRLRTSNPTDIFESNFIYDLAPLKWEAITSSGTVAHDSTNSCADLSISAATGLAALQTYRWHRYQPGKSQLVEMTFKLGTYGANTTYRVGAYNATNSGATVTLQNGLCLEVTGATPTYNWRILSTTSAGNQTVAAANWNIDGFGLGGNAKNPSGITLDMTKTQILFIDYQWLGVGRVRCGFVVNGVIYYAHEFLNANNLTEAYAKLGTLPLRAEVVTSASASASMSLICTAVISEGGTDPNTGYNFAYEFTGTAGSSAWAHIGSFRPYVTFNSVANRTLIIPDNVTSIVTGAQPVIFRVTYGATYSAGPTWGAAQAYTNSAVEVTTASGTISTTPIVSHMWYNPASGANKSSESTTLLPLYPLAITANAANYANGTLGIDAYGIGGTSACRVSAEWRELR